MMYQPAMPGRPIFSSRYSWWKSIMSSLMTASDGVYTPRMVKVQSPGKMVPCRVTFWPTRQPNLSSSRTPISAAERSWRKACFWSSGTTSSGYISR